MANAQSLYAEVCLKYPQDIGLHQTLSPESAVTMLLRAVTLAAQMPFVWSYIDKPVEGSLHMIYLVPQQTQFPNDGIRYLSPEQRFTIPAGQGRELEVCEAKHGFIPDGQDNAAFRVRRRYRLVRGGHPSLVLIHYSRGNPVAIPPQVLTLPVRQYPLQPVNEPATYVLGEKAGQRVYPQGGAATAHMQRQAHPGHQGQPAGVTGPIGMQPGHQAALLAAQNREMEAMERRQARERAAIPHHPHMQQDEDSGDEFDHISTRSLALTRYKRNHDYMNEVFNYAALGKLHPKKVGKVYACFDEKDLRAKLENLEKEVDELRNKAAQRQEEARLREEQLSEGLNRLAADSEVAMDVSTSANQKEVTVL